MATREWESVCFAHSQLIVHGVLVLYINLNANALGCMLLLLLLFGARKNSFVRSQRTRKQNKRSALWRKRRERDGKNEEKKTNNISERKEWTHHFSLFVRRVIHFCFRNFLGQRMELMQQSFFWLRGDRIEEMTTKTTKTKKKTTVTLKQSAKTRTMCTFVCHCNTCH